MWDLAPDSPWQNKNQLRKVMVIAKAKEMAMEMATKVATVMEMVTDMCTLSDASSGLT